MSTHTHENQRNAAATTGLVLGLASIVFYVIGILPILATIFSGVGLAKAGDLGGAGRTQAWIGLVLGALYTLMYMKSYGHL